MSLNGKTAIVFGGGRDIGRAVAEGLAREGAAVTINYCNDEAGAKAAVAAIEAAGRKAIAEQGDATNRWDVARVVANHCAAFGDRIDVVVNVVGGLVARKTIAEMDEAFLEQVLKLNVTSAFLATQAALPHMAEGGSIINFASQAGRDGGGPGAIAYGASKGAVLTMTRGMAKELGPKGIRVNAVCPGMIATTFHDTFTKDEVRANVAAATPLRREGQSNEVADLVCYLASDKAAFVTGAGIDINGGTFFS
ncbi:SDR family NAD(P)-dependent oxidoreductase [Croceicoccus naphthovorans]|uniref:Oxidoreductase n=1 Tax=Croceicoccus naphthovorans TaxID=1348774 RepID=A0A0G3XGA9_9SPHN|nr:glucose 1-dehydrogenase [Croceicoccus naphthovorans]AKM09438.1 oxidoreductase [Croceicoccus naphthovorans]MBB3991948.1 3-oxoacyl-[acyl-carrier protein] reductase [Croceicoccus naphthovorans]